jgi:hypothetical protein
MTDTLPSQLGGPPMEPISTLASAISFASLTITCGGILYLLLVYRRTMRQYKAQMDQTVLEMRRQNDALETLMGDHAQRLARLER